MNPPPNFNRLARLYLWMELVSFGPWLMLCRCAFLKECRAARRALALGDGDGRFTARLLRQNSAIQIDAVDVSPAMLEALVHRAGTDTNRVHAFHADIRSWKPHGPPYDLIVSHFFLDCLTTEEIQSLAATLAHAVSPNSFWIVSEFAIPANWFGRLIARPVVWTLYRAFGWITGLQVRSLPDHSIALREVGFTLQERRHLLGGLLISELWTLAPTSPGAGDSAFREPIPNAIRTTSITSTSALR
jgi:SAM-dependent methyltransferase